MTACGNKMSGVCGRCMHFNRCRNSEIAKLPKTNIEWMRTASLEQLAEEILGWWFDGANAYSEFGLYSWEVDEAKERILEWLKEVHK